MPLSIAHLRRWFAGGAIAVMLIVAGVYFYARHRVQNALRQVPEKIGIEIKQSATGFSISKSEQGRTLFKIEASKAVQFKQGGRAELHEVAITLYGRDSSRYDHIYGKDFEYDPQSGNVTAQGEIEINLEANPAGILNPDQAAPKELKNPIHLKTSGLVFNQKTGDAYTKQSVEFRLPQASGSAMGVRYAATTNVLTLESELKIVGTSDGNMTLTASRGTIAKNPRQIVLDQPRIKVAARQCEAGKATVFLRQDNTMERILAAGDVRVSSEGGRPAEVRAEQLELVFAKAHDSLRTATFSGNVTASGSGGELLQANAGRVVLDFAAKNLLKHVHAEDNVRLLQHPNPSGPSAGAQDVELSAPVVDFVLSQASHLERAQTSGAAQIAMRSAMTGNGPQTLVTAGKFVARFDRSGQLSSVQGTTDARIVSQNPGQPDRVSTSQTIEAAFRRGGGIESIVQQGGVAYTDGERRAWGDRARYTPADQVLVLSGSPRVTESGMTTTARSMRLDRTTGNAFAEGDVKSTYSDLKPQPDGALLASGSPIHITARSMTVHGTPAVALYTGDARLWQDANIVEAASIEFDRDHRSMVASGASGQSVSTVLMRTGKKQESTPVAVTSSRLTYTDSERRVHFEGNVITKVADVTITAQQMDAFLEARGPSTSPQSSSPVGKLDKIVAAGGVVITQPSRRATGDQLVYNGGEDKFVLTGGPPSIFDAEHGKITGVSLTFYRHDDTVLVEGNSSSPAVTQTRVAR